MTAEHFPTHLRTLRLKAGITQTTAAHAAGVCVTTWRAWERGTKTPRSWRCPAIAHALNVPVAGLFTDATVFEVVLEPGTVEEVRQGGREAASAVADRLARRLEPRLWEEATKKPVDVRDGARPKPRRTRVEKLAGVQQANAMREAALERRSLAGVS